MLSAPASRLPILVIDDDSALIRTLSDILRLHGYSPETAETALEGLALAELHPPALAVVDFWVSHIEGRGLPGKLAPLLGGIGGLVAQADAPVEEAERALASKDVP